MMSISRLTRIAQIACVALSLASPATRAAAKLCGDDVNGQDIPCACGDILASSVVLGDDPVTTEVCPRDGLLVRAQDERSAIRLDLHGHTLRGSGNGTGLRILNGGPGGLRIVSSGGTATLQGFGDGITSRGGENLALIEDVVVHGGKGDGIRVSGRSFIIRRVVVEQVARDGFSLNGAGFEITDTRASDSGRYGYSVMGQSGSIGTAGHGNVAERSAIAGFSIMGNGHTLDTCTARDGQKDGVMLLATKLDVRNCDASGNAGNGIAGVGSHWQLAGNHAQGNGGDGVSARGLDMIDGGGNRGSDNRGAGRARVVVQCEIGGAACRS